MPARATRAPLLRAIIMLLQPVSGSIRVFGQEVVGLSDEQALPLRRRWGVMFERGALFSSLTVAENVALPLREHSHVEKDIVDIVLKTRAYAISFEGANPRHHHEWEDFKKTDVPDDVILVDTAGRLHTDERLLPRKPLARRPGTLSISALRPIPSARCSTSWPPSTAPP